MERPLGFGRLSLLNAVRPRLLQPLLAQRRHDRAWPRPAPATGPEAVQAGGAGESRLPSSSARGAIGVMICADRRDKAIVQRFVTGGAEFLVTGS